jgi:DNA-binding CsgD family transcriptional regulator
MLKSEDINDDFYNFTHQILEFAFDLDDYKDQLIDWEKVSNSFVLCNQFFYINDFSRSCNIYVHPNIKNVIGYQPEEFYDFARIYELIHPDDMEFVYEFSKRSIAFCKYYKQELLLNPFQTLFTIDFRIMHFDGNFIKLKRQTTCLKTDREGNMIFALVHFTDVTNTKRGNGYNISWVGDTKYIFYFDDLIKKYHKDCSITKRERIILNLLAEGQSATKIAEKLCLSVHTVISHRKHLLEKTGAKNTVELVKIAVEKDLL